MHLMSEERLPLATEKLAEILKDCGFETHPKGMSQPSAADIEQSSDGKSAYFDDGNRVGCPGAEVL